jgi:hypothetical protein
MTELVRPEATGEGLDNRTRTALGEGLGEAQFTALSFAASLAGQEVPAFARDGLGYSSGQIDMFDDLARRYDGLDIENTLVALAADDTLRDEVMEALMENDQELAHHVAQAFQADEGLQAQFEDMLRTNPENVRGMLPALREDPSQFAELVAAGGRDPATAAAANAAAATATAEGNQASMADFFRGIMSGETSFADILGDRFGGMLDSMLGPLLGAFQGMIDSVQGWVGQNVDPEGPGMAFVETISEATGVDLTAGVTDVTAPTPDTDPAPVRPRARPDELTGPAAATPS